MFYMFDWTYLVILLPAVLLAGCAQIAVSSTFRKYSTVPSQAGRPASQVAQAMLQRCDLNYVPVEKIPGKLTDHYDPRAKKLSLSQSVFDSASVGTIGVAAHEVGHALQDKESYLPLRIRSALVPVVNLASSLAIPLILLGFLFQLLNMVYVGIVVFSVTVVFQLVTLPVEFNASRRAIAFLGQSGSLTAEELTGAKKVLRAAAMTYVASTLVALAQLLRLVLLANRRN